MVYFTFTRLITDHLKQPALTALRQQEINFTSTLLREKVPTCLYESERSALMCTNACTSSKRCGLSGGI